MLHPADVLLLISLAEPCGTQLSPRDDRHPDAILHAAAASTKQRIPCFTTTAPDTGLAEFCVSDSQADFQKPQTRHFFVECGLLPGHRFAAPLAGA